MSDEISALTSALAAVNTLGEKLTSAVDKLIAHNIDAASHEDLRQAIEQLKEGTDEQMAIYDIINEKLTAHTESDFKTAHGGWDEFETSLNEKLADIQEQIDNIDTGGESGTPRAELYHKIQDITNKYASMLDSLQTAYENAKADGQTELAESFLESIKSTLATQKAEILEAVAKYNEEYADEDVPAADYSEQIAALETTVTNLETTISSLEAQVTTNRTNIASNTSAIAELRTALNQSAATMTALGERIETLTNKMSDVQSFIDNDLALAEYAGDVYVEEA